MSDRINDGGPAFPMRHSVFPSGNIEYGSPGMSLRDYLAAAALTGLLANPGRRGGADSYARDAYDQSDAMLAASKPKEG